MIQRPLLTGTFLACCCCAMLLLSGCGGSDDPGGTWFSNGTVGNRSGGLPNGGNTGGNPNPTQPTNPGGNVPASGGGPAVTLTGTVRYQHYELTPTNGINYNNSMFSPVRGATVQVRNGNDDVLFTAVTDANGDYSIQTPSDINVYLVVVAQLGNDVRVVDNTANSFTYAAADVVTVGTGTTVYDMDIESGWGGTSYSGQRRAGPFSILDTIYQAMELVRGVDSSVNFPPLVVNWSVRNRPQSGSRSTGAIGTSFYDGDLWILGAEDVDTDEYDIAIVAHEWVHYLDDVLANSDHIGGGHGHLDILDPMVAFGEGIATAFGCMIIGSNHYIDTMDTRQGNTAVYHDAEGDEVADNRRHPAGLLYDGYYSEQSIIEVVWDIFDSGTLDTDGDPVGLGFGPLYQVFVGSHANSPAFKSIFSFLHHLKLANPGSATGITTIAAGENIPDGDAYQGNRASDDYYTMVPGDGSVVNTDMDGRTLASRNDYPVGGGTGLYERMFFQGTAPTAGRYTLQITPSSGIGLFLPVSFANAKGLDDYTFSNGPLSFGPVSLSAGETFPFCVGATPNDAFTVRLTRTGPKIQRINN